MNQPSDSRIGRLAGNLGRRGALAAILAMTCQWVQAGHDQAATFEDVSPLTISVRNNDGPIGAYDSTGTFGWRACAYDTPNPNTNTTLGLNRGGSVTGIFNYTMNLNRAGTDSYGYRNCAYGGYAGVYDVGPNVVYVTVSPVADTPNLSVSNSTGNEDTSIPLSITPSLNDLDGSETLSVIISNVPSGSTMAVGTETPPGSGSYVLTAAQVPSAAITPPANDDNDFTLDVVARATEATFTVGPEYLTPDFSRIVSDSATRTINVNVNPVNDTPVAVADSYSVNEGATVSGTAGTGGTGVLHNDSDPDGDSMTVSLVSSPANASSFTLNTNGSFTYTHNGSETSSDAFTYRVSDGALNSSTVTVSISVSAVNDNTPVTVADAYTLAEGGSVTGSAGLAGTGVLGNDSDADLPPNTLTVSLVASPSRAAAFALNTNGSFSYTHDGSENLTDSFTYRVNDGVNTSATTTVSLTMTAVNDNSPVAVNDNYTVAEGYSVSGTAGLAGTGVLGNDTDADAPGDSVTVTEVNGSGANVGVAVATTTGSVVVNANGSFTYTHNDDNVYADSFTYRISDGTSDSTATVNFSITPVNIGAPDGVDDAYGPVDEGDTLSIAAVSGVLANDSDPDGDPMTVTVSTPPAYASAFTLNANGSFTYTNDGSENFSDSFTYIATDGTDSSPPITVTLSITPVNDQTPSSAADAYSLSEGATASGTAGLGGTGVLGNDSDADLPGDSLTVTLVTPPARDSAFSLNADGSFSYTHDGSENFTDSFTYTVADGVNTGAVTTVSITITPDNDQVPVTVADSYLLNEGASITGTAGLSGTGVLGNDSDADLPGDTLLVSLVAGPSNADSFGLSADGSFSYSHDDSETFSDSFTYQVSDGVNTSAVTTVSLTINPVNDQTPVASADAYSVDEGDSLSAASVLVNDSDADLPGDTLTATLVASPVAAASFTFNADGTFSYVHDDSEVLSDSFTYTTSDGVNTSVPATVTLTINAVNDNTPAVTDDAYSLLEGDSVSGTAGLSGSGVLGNDSDADLPGDSLQASLVAGPAFGALSLNPDGSFAYTHDGSENFSDSFTYNVYDGTNTSVTATVTVTITPVNDNTPSVTDDAYTLAEGGTTTGTAGLSGTGVLGNDADADRPGDSLVVEQLSSPANAALFALNPDGSFTYQHDGSENLSDSFTYRVSDGTNTSGVATVTLSMTAVNDNAPVGGPDAVSLDEQSSVTFDLLANDSDADEPGDTLTVTKVNGSAASVGSTLAFASGAGTYSIASDGTLTVTATSTATVEAFSESLTYAIEDGASAAEDIAVTITINPVNDNAPTSLGLPDLTVDEDAADSSVDLAAVFSDLDIDADGLLDGVVAEDNDTLTFAVSTSDASLAAVTITGNSLSIDYQPDQHGTADITVTATDGAARTVSDTFALTVNSVNDAPVYRAGSYSDLSIDEDDPPVTIALSSAFEDPDLDDGDASDESLTYRVIMTVTPDEFVRTDLFELGGMDIVVVDEDTFYVETTDASISFPLVADAFGTAEVTVQAIDRGRPPESPADAVPLDAESTFTITVASVGGDVPVAVDDGSAGTPIATVAEDGEPIEIVVLNNDGLGDPPARVVSAGQVLDIDGQLEFYRTTTRSADLSNTGDLTTVPNGEVACNQCGSMSDDSTITNEGLPVDTIRYKPGANFHGTDSFEYCIQDSDGADESCATVYVEVTEVNDPPDTSASITYTMTQAADLVVDAASGLRSKVVDVDNTHIDGFGCDPLAPDCSPAADEPQPDRLYFRLVSAVTEHGNLLPPFLDDGSFSYRPEASFSGTDTFEFDVCDEPFATATADDCVFNAVVNIVIAPVEGAPRGSTEGAVEFDYDLSDGPLELPPGAEANVLVIMDDSGSMQWDIMTDQTEGLFYYSTGDFIYYTLKATAGSSDEVAPSEAAAPGHGLWRLRNSTYNKTYYNPEITYSPWPGTDTDDNPFEDAVPTAARHDPLNSRITTDLTALQTYVGKAPTSAESCAEVCVGRWTINRRTGLLECSRYATTCSRTVRFDRITTTDYYIPNYYTWTDRNGDGLLDATPSPATDPGTAEGTLVEIKASTPTYPKGAARFDCVSVADVCTYAEEIQNFANWFTYARTRNQIGKYGLGTVIAEVENLRIGYALLNDATNRAGIASINTDPATGVKKNLLDEIYTTPSNGGTPLRGAMEKAGKHFECAAGDVFGSRSRNTPGASACPILPAPEGNCQMNFLLLVTDGAWNGDNDLRGYPNADGDDDTDFDGGKFADNHSTLTLGDLAMHYYERDLWPDLDDEVPTTAIDRENAPEAAFGNGGDTMHQHMTTYTVGFGIVGSIDPATVPTDYTAAFSWPDPVTQSGKVDDLLHAAVNGRGRYLSAGDPSELTVALQSAFEDFASGSGAASAVSFNSQEVQEETVIFRAFYNTRINTGDLIAQRLTEAGLEETPVWSAATMLDARTYDNRSILTWDGEAKTGIPFRPDQLNTAQRETFIDDPTGTLTDAQKDAQVLEGVNYIRGDATNERPAGILRERPDEAGRLGDIVHSTPVFVGFPDRLNRDAEPYPQSNPYSSFAGAYSGRTKMIYVNANDGMLHGIRAEDGYEVFGYVPNSNLASTFGRKVSELLSYDYSHKYFVDLTNGINDVYMDTNGDGSQEWATVLVGGHGAGAKGYFSLNVTDPTRFTEGTADQVALWEFTDADDSYPTEAGVPLTNADGTQKLDLQTTPQPVKDLGYTFSVPTIAMSNLQDEGGENRWIAAFGNGYNSSAGIAKLFVLFLEGGVDGTWCHPDMIYNSSLTPSALPADCVGRQDFVKLDTGFGVPSTGPNAGFPNGLGTPRGIDVDGNGTIDYAYAGDTLGNFFRFDMTSSNFSEWTVTKIFEAKYIDPVTGTETPQPITTQPIVLEHPTEPDGYIVIFGTGSYVTDEDGINEDVQSIYGLWDRLGPEFIQKDDLVEQNYENRLDASFGNVRVLSDNAVDYSIESRRKGWFIDLDPPAAGGTQDVDPPEFPGERAIRNIQMRGGIAFVNSVIPRSNTSCTSHAGGFALSFCPGTGGTTCLDGNQIFDLNNDGVFDEGDETAGAVVAATRFEDAVPTDSTFIGESRVTQLSDQSLDASLTNTAGGVNTGRLSWKQLPTVE